MKKKFLFDEKLKVVQDLTHEEANRLRGGTQAATTATSTSFPLPPFPSVHQPAQVSLNGGFTGITTAPVTAQWNQIGSIGNSTVNMQVGVVQGNGGAAPGVGIAITF